MLGTLQSKLESALQRIRGKSVISAADVEDAMREIRRALLDADVNFKVVRDFCTRVGDKAVGEKVLKSLSSGQQIVKIVHDELVNLMGAGATPLNIQVAPPAVLLLVGLQGSGKTTTAAKLARLINIEHKKKPLLVPADVYRPAAIEQLRTLGRNLGIQVFEAGEDRNPVSIATRAVEHASLRDIDVVIIDTAGRLQVDDELMRELVEIRDKVSPHEILLVADAMTGQEAVNVAQGFNTAVGITGLILTKLDGDARGGAALSMRAVTGQPIKFVGLGEKAEAFEVFHPERLATRILGMGDVLTLVEKAAKAVSEDEAKQLEKKLRRNEFTFDDFLSQMRMVRKMGSISSLTSMIPGMSKIADSIDPSEMEKEMKQIEAIVLSMTPKERRSPGILNGSRRRRIANGSGTNVEKVNQLVKQFTEMKKVMSTLAKGGIGELFKMMGGGGRGMKLPKGFPPFGG